MRLSPGRSTRAVVLPPTCDLVRDRVSAGVGVFFTAFVTAPVARAIADDARVVAQGEAEVSLSLGSPREGRPGNRYLVVSLCIYELVSSSVPYIALIRLSTRQSCASN